MTAPATRARTAPQNRQEPRLVRLLPVMPRLDLDVMRDAQLNGYATTTRLLDSIHDVEMELTMNGASVLRLAVVDDELELMRSPVLRDRVDLDLGPRMPGYRRWRLDRPRDVGGLLAQDGVTTLRFWDLGPAALKLQTTPLRIPAERMGLERFVSRLAREVSDDIRLRVVVPRPGERPPVDDQADVQRAGGGVADTYTSGSGSGSPHLTDGQKVFGATLATLTAMNPQVIAAWVLAEMSAGAAQARERAGNHNWLNVAYYDTGPGAITTDPIWSDPVKAAGATFEFLQGRKWGASAGIQQILRSAGKPAMQQIDAIAGSGWASSGYNGGANLRGTYATVGSDPFGDALQGRDLSALDSTNDPEDPDNRPSEWRRGRERGRRPESSWGALRRHAEQLGRRRFITQRRLVVARDQDLIRATPHQTISYNDHVLQRRPTIDVDGAARMQAIDLEAFAAGWFTPPGGVVQIADAGAANGPWLVETLIYRGGDPTVNVQLTKPTTQRPTSGRRSSRQGSRFAGRDGAEAAIAWATAQIGVRETTANGGPKINDWQAAFGQGRVPWCGIFVGMALRAANVSNVSPHIASVQWIHDTSAVGGHPFQGRTQAANGRPGDLAILYGSDKHVELVVSVNVSRGIVTTIGGNTSLHGGGQGVARKDRAFAQVIAIAQVRYPQQ